MALRPMPPWSSCLSQRARPLPVPLKSLKPRNLLRTFPPLRGMQGLPCTCLAEGDPRGYCFACLRRDAYSALAFSRTARNSGLVWLMVCLIIYHFLQIFTNYLHYGKIILDYPQRRRPGRPQRSIGCIRHTTGRTRLRQACGCPRLWRRSAQAPRSSSRPCRRASPRRQTTVSKTSSTCTAIWCATRRPPSSCTPAATPWRAPACATATCCGGPVPGAEKRKDRHRRPGRRAHRQAPGQAGRTNPARAGQSRLSRVRRHGPGGPVHLGRCDLCRAQALAGSDSMPRPWNPCLRLRHFEDLPNQRHERIDADGILGEELIVAHATRGNLRQDGPSVRIVPTPLRHAKIELQAPLLRPGRQRPATCPD